VRQYLNTLSDRDGTGIRLIPHRDAAIAAVCYRQITDENFRVAHDAGGFFARGDNLAPFSFAYLLKINNFA
jgi:hypothetical protein